ncbi:T9SS type A sorting domain-containing protein [Bacteroidales bacterium]|nr:T9SS type A sorting domain-containing protein [Bacteroidales bacterium]
MKWILPLISSFLITFFCYGTSDKTNTPPFLVTFNLNNGTDSIENAMVILNTDTLYTAINGSVTFEDVSADTIFFKISAHGYQTIESWRLLNSDTTLYLMPTPIVSVSFIITDGEFPIDSAMLITNNDTIYSSADGVISFDTLMYTDLHYKIDAYDFDTINAKTFIKSDTTFNIALNRLYDVTFKITDGEYPIHGIEAELNGKRRVTKEDGFCTFRDIPKGKHKVLFSHPYQYYWESINYDLMVTGDQTDTITLKESGMVELSKVTIVVTDKSNNPIEGANVYISSSTFYTDETGSALFPHVACWPINLNISIEAEGFYNYISVYASGGDKTDSIALIAKPTALITTHENNVSSVFPNPCNDKLNINMAEGMQISEMELYDLNGKKIKTFISATEENNITIDISDIAPGTYILKVKNHKNQYIHRIIKQ